MAANNTFAPPSAEEQQALQSMFAPPSKDEQAFFAAPSADEMAQLNEKTTSLKDKLLKAAYYGTRPLDYMGGLVRTGAAEGVQGGANLYSKLKSLATGQDDDMPQVVTGDDMLSALKGAAPPTAEYLKRAGVPEGGKLSDIAPMLYSNKANSFRPTPGGMLDPSLRGAGGAAIDMALDPLTYLGAGPLKKLLPVSQAGKEASVLQKAGDVASAALNPLEQGLQGGGKAIYKSAPTMKAVDQIGNQFGKDTAIVNGVEVPSTVSDELFNRGIRGSGRSIAEQAEEAANKLGETRNDILARGDKAGGSLNMDAAMQPAQDLVNKIRVSRDPQLMPLADSLEERIAKYKNLRASSEVPAQTVTDEIRSSLVDAGGNPITTTSERNIPAIPASPGVNPSQGSGFKSSLYNDTGNAAWDTLRRTPQGAQANKALARGLDKETTAAVDRALPGEGTPLDATNDAWGKLLTTAKTMEKEARKGEGKNIFTSVDGMILPFVHEHPALIATKKAADLSKSNYFRTNLGLGTYNLGKIPLLDEVTRRSILNNQSQNNPSPWSLLQKDK